MTLNIHKHMEQPAVAYGFEHINRYWDAKHECWAAKILPGEFYVSSYGEMISTVLGSCISACVRDKKLGIGGMNHFMLPEQTEHSTNNWGSDPSSASSRYGNWAMEYLINEILKRGGKKQNLEVKVFGGGQMIANMTDIGQRNILFVYQYLANEGLQIEAADVGDIYARKILYFPDTGRVKLLRITNTKNDTVVERERSYASQIRKDKGQDNNVELFD